MRLEKALPKAALVFAFWSGISFVAQAAPEEKAARSGKATQDPAPSPTRLFGSRTSAETTKAAPGATPSSTKSPAAATSAPTKGTALPAVAAPGAARVRHRADKAAAPASSPGEKMPPASSSAIKAVQESVSNLRTEVAQMHQQLSELRAYDDTVVGQLPPVQKASPSQEELARTAALATDLAAIEAKLAKLEAAVSSGAVERDAVAPSFDALRDRRAKITSEQERLAAQSAPARDKPHPMLQRLGELEKKVTELQPTSAAPPAQTQLPAIAPPSDAVATPATPPRPALTWDGLVDSHALWNFTASPSTAGQKYRAFDTRSNSFTLSYAKLGAQLDAGLATFRMDLGYGHTGAIVNQSSGAASAGSATDTLSASLYSSAFLMEQAYAEVRLGTRFVLDAGKFLTSAGAEVIETPKNWMYSRSLLFYGQPALHTGLRLNFKAHDQLTIQASVVDGCNNDPAPRGDKTYGVSLTYTPSAATVIVATSYIGRYAVFNNAAPPADDVQVLADLVATHNVSDALGFNINLDYFTAGSTHWYGASGMVRYVAMPKLVLALRGELVRSTLAYAAELGNAGYLGEGTLMLGVPLSPNYELRVEGRVDGASESVFVKDAHYGRRSQATGLIGFLAFF